MQCLFGTIYLDIGIVRALIKRFTDNTDTKIVEYVFTKCKPPIVNSKINKPITFEKGRS